MSELAYQAMQIAYRWRTCDHVIEYQGRKVAVVRQALKRAVVRAGITGKFFGAHAIRHSIAALLADKKIDLRMVKKLLGHQDFGTTDRIYAKHSRGYLEPAVAIVDEALGGIEPEKLADVRAKGGEKG